MPTPITAGLTRRVDHHACRQRSDRSTAPPPRYPSSAPTPGRSEGWPITTACMVCAVRSRLAGRLAAALPRRKTRNCGRVGVHLPAATGGPATQCSADWENIGHQLAAANPVACPEERRCRSESPPPHSRRGRAVGQADRQRAPGFGARASTSTGHHLLEWSPRASARRKIRNMAGGRWPEHRRDGLQPDRTPLSAPCVIQGGEDQLGRTPPPRDSSTVWTGADCGGRTRASRRHCGPPAAVPIADDGQLWAAFGSVVSPHGHNQGEVELVEPSSSSQPAGGRAARSSSRRGSARRSTPARCSPGRALGRPRLRAHSRSTATPV
jgi:hypothetical protein